MADEILQLFEGDFKGGSKGDFLPFSSDEKAILQRIALLEDQYLKHRRKTGFSDKRSSIFGNAPLVFLCHISINSAIFSLMASAAAITGFKDKCVYLWVIELMLCPNNPAMMLSEYPISAAIVAKLYRNA